MGGSRFPSRVLEPMKIHALTILRIYTGAVFIQASLDKIAYPAVFARAIDNYMLAPAILVPVAAATIPFIELFTGILLIAGLFTRESALIFAGLMSFFFTAALITMIRGIDILCGCFSATGGGRVDLLHAAYQFFLILASLLVFLYDKGTFGLDRLRTDRR